ncbi:hypothetical protein EBU71_18790 [bacterium]|nr:hypothetical protein [Candidatus Elulimicrobium humile]
MSEKGFVPHWLGGLGNQIFQVAGNYICAKHWGVPLYLYKNNNNEHNKHGHDYLQSIFKPFGIHYDTYFNTHDMINQGYSTVDITEHNYGPWSPEQFHPGTVITGYFQYYKTFIPYEEELRNLLLEGLEGHRSKLTVQLGDLSDCAFLHVRRADTYRSTHVYYYIEIDWYKKAVDDLLSKKKIRKIYIITDDRDWVLQQDYFKDPIFEFFDSNDELESFTLMTLCTAAAICGGQTYGWWGAYLGAYALRNPIYFPKYWVKRPQELIPDDWIQLE